MTENKNIPRIRFEGFTDPWEQRKLGEVACIVGGGTPNTGIHAYWDGDIDWYSPAELGERIYADGSVRKITQAGYDSCSAIMLPANKTILFTSRAGIGNVAILRRPACTNQGFQSLIVDDDADVYFVYSMAGAIKKYAEQKASGSTFLEISGKSLAAGEFAFPAKYEQIKIGSAFRCLDSLITLHQRKYEKLQKLKKSMLDKMFPKPGELYPEIRFEGFTDPWEQRKLGENCTFAKGRGYSKADIRKSGTPLILYGRLYTQYQSRIDIVDTYADMQDDSVLSKGAEVIVPASGETAEDIAVAASVRSSGILLGGDLNVITPGARIDPDFLALEITYGEAHNKLAKCAQGKSVVHIHNEDIADVDFVCPELAEQRTIATTIHNLDSLIALHQRKLELLKNIKKSLLDRMFV